MPRKDKTTVGDANGSTLDSSSLFTDFTPEEVLPPIKPTETKPKKQRKVTEIQSPQEPPITCGSDEANALLDILQPVCSKFAAKIYNVDVKVTSRAFVFTEDHRKRINPPLIRVMNKWLPSLVKKFSDELGLAVVLSAVVNSQIRMMHIYAEAEKQQANPPNVATMPTPTPVPTPVASVDGKAGD